MKRINDVGSPLRRPEALLRPAGRVSRRILSLLIAILSTEQ